MPVKIRKGTKDRAPGPSDGDTIEGGQVRFLAAGFGEFDIRLRNGSSPGQESS